MKTSAWAAMLGGFALGSACAGSACAQMHVVKKPENVVRAVGVYEWTGSETKPAASRFVPVTLFIDGHLEDAAVYLARPVPFALQTGTIFEMEHSGVAQGTLELSFARHLVSTGEIPLDDGWLGFGSYKPAAKAKAEPSTLRAGRVQQVEVSGGKPRPSFSNASAKPAATPSTSTTTDNSTDPDRPTLTRKPGNPAPPDNSTPSATTTTTAPTQSTASTTTTDADPDRPTMKRRTDPDTSSNGTASGTGSQSTTATDASATPASDPDRPTMKRPSTDSTATAKTNDDDRAPEADPERPTLRRRSEAQREAARKEHDSSSVTGSAASLNDDPDRPSLHRGKPAGSLDEDDLPALQGLPADVHQEIGVSDAANRAEHDFRRPWEDDAEHAAVLSSMQASARALMNGAAPATPAAPPVSRTASAAQRRAAGIKKAPAKIPAPADLGDEHLNGYTLSYGGAATYVYSASSTGVDGGARFVTVIAQREPSGELKVALSNVTDSAHLDRTPRFQLVDAVDAEASNRASLLFELRAQNSRQFALYRVIGAEAQQIFLTGSTQ